MAPAELARALANADLVAVDLMRARPRLLPPEYPDDVEELLRAHIASLDFPGALALLGDERVASALPEQSDARHRILLVDDTPATVLLLRSMLSGIGTLRFALNSDDAIALTERWKPDLVLCDVNLDHRSGLDICRHVKRGQILDEPAMILISAQSDLRSEVAALTAGADDFIEKPLQVARVLSRVHTQLARRAREGAATAMGSIRLRPEILGFITCSLAGRIVDMAPRVRRQLGVDLQSPVNAALTDFVPAQGSEELQARILASGTAGRFGPVELSLVGPNGVIPARLTGWVAPGDQGRVLWISVEDLGERIVRERRKIDGALARSVTAMLGGIAHEFNNILAIAQGNLVTVLEADPGEPLDRSRLVRASEAIDRAIAISRSFGSTAMRAPGSIPRQRIDEQLQRLRPLLQVPERRAGDLVLQLDAGDAELALEPDGLRSMLQNLIDNAMEASVAHSPVVLRSYVERPEDAEAAVVLEVEDHGQGMAEEVRARALDPFFTTGAPRRRGLGLTEARGFVISHDGAIDLITAPGAGTLVRMRFPLPD